MTDQALTMRSLPVGYGAIVFGASGGIGSAVAQLIAADARCGGLLQLHRGSSPPLELTDEATIAAAAAHALDSLGPAHLLFDATGILGGPQGRPEKRLAELDPAAMANSFAVNAIGPALLFKHFSACMPRQCRAVFATLSARVGSIGDNRRGGWIGYRASKAALNQVVRTAAIEIARQRPRAVCIALQPGTVATPLSAPYRSAGMPDVLEPAESARRLLAVLDRADPSLSGGFLDHRGHAIDW